MWSLSNSLANLALLFTWESTLPSLPTPVGPSKLPPVTLYVEGGLGLHWHLTAVETGLIASHVGTSLAHQITQNGHGQKKSMKAIYRFKSMWIKISIAFVTEREQTILKFVWKLWERRTGLENSCSLTSGFTTKLQWLNNRTVLAQKQICRSMECNREPRNEPTITRSINLWQRKQEYAVRKSQFLQ